MNDIENPLFYKRTDRSHCGGKLKGKVIRFRGTHLGVEKLHNTPRFGLLDAVFIATGLTCNRELYESFKEEIEDIYVVADASEPKEVTEALRMAEEIVIRI